jgi:hypothetical protein
MRKHGIRQQLSNASAKVLYSENLKQAHARWGVVRTSELDRALFRYSSDFEISISAGELLLIDNRWYVTHAGLLSLACRRRCLGIQVRPVPEFSAPTQHRWAFQATVYKSRTCKGFVGFGDADPTTVPASFRGAEMRIAETRAVNRALRKAYGLGICSVEELGASSGPAAGAAEKRPPQSANGHHPNSHARLRDRLCQLIRQHQLDAALVKSYAVDFCRVGALKDAKREQVEAFVEHLSESASKDRDALLCQLNSYRPPQQEAA